MTGTLYAARCCGNKYATDFPVHCRIDFDEESEDILTDQIITAVSYDHDPANFGGKGRSNKNFLCADICTLDIDNTDPDEAKWASVGDIRKAFDGVAGFVVRSRNYMKPSHGNTAPRYHVYFLTDPMQDGEHLRALRKACNDVLGVFTVDEEAMDPSRLTYGVENPHVELLYGDKTLDQFMRDHGIDVDGQTAADGSDGGEIQFNRTGSGSSGGTVYHEGHRNTEVHRAFLQYLTRYGDKDPDAVRQAFENIAGRCRPPLGNKELNEIYKSSMQRYTNDIKTQEGYTSPEEYEAKMAQNDFNQDPTDQDAPEQSRAEQIKALGDLLVADRSDVGQGEAFATLYGDRILYFEGDWLYYDGHVWESNKAKVQQLEQDHTKRQLNICNKKIMDATKEKLNAQKESPAEAEAKRKIDEAEKDRNWVLGRRRFTAVDAAVKAARPLVQVKADELDADPELLNTPDGIIDLRSGILSPSDPAARCTRITDVGPGDQGKDIWLEFIGQITNGDDELAVYLQQVSGMFLIGKVMLEKLILAYGSGGNGKSSYFNTLQSVMGTYAGGLAADVLTTSGRSNAKAEMAELRGKRLVVCAELSEGCRLNSSMLKQLCSTDMVRAEKKYQDPFSFQPSHSVVLYSNYLPRVSAQDSGTWSRIAIVPFLNTFRGKPGEVLNYSKYLTEAAGPAVLQWMIDGAVQFLAAGGILSTPDAVDAAVKQYRAENDTVQMFIDDACMIGDEYCKQSKAFYVCYKNYCDQADLRHLSIQDFYKEMTHKGFQYVKTKRYNEIKGITTND